MLYFECLLLLFTLVVNSNYKMADEEITMTISGFHTDEGEKIGYPLSRNFPLA